MQSENEKNVDTVNINNESFAQKDALTLGQTLKRTREMRHISTDEVARRILVSKSVVEDLENDDYTRIAASTYAKGYLRAYAKLLRLPEDLVIEGFNALQPKVGVLHQHNDVKYDMNTDVVLYKKIKWFGYAVLALLIFFVVAWVWGNHNGSSKSDVATEQNSLQIEQPGSSGLSDASTASQAVATDSTVKSTAIKKDATEKPKSSKSASDHHHHLQHQGSTTFHTYDVSN